MEILDSEGEDPTKVIGLDPTAVDLMRLNSKQRTFYESNDIFEVEEISFSALKSLVSKNSPQSED